MSKCIENDYDVDAVVKELEMYLCSPRKEGKIRYLLIHFNKRQSRLLKVESMIDLIERAKNTHIDGITNLRNK